MSPTRRTLDVLRADGWLAEVTQYRLPIPGAHVTRDLFGCVDILAIKPDRTRALQVTSGTNTASRVKKICALPHVLQLLEAWDLEVWGWVQRRPSLAWEARRVRIIALMGERRQYVAGFVEVAPIAYRALARPRAQRRIRA